MPNHANGITRSELITLERDSIYRVRAEIEKYVDTRLGDAREYVDIRFADQVRETEIALEALRERLILLQELRDTVDTTVKNNVPMPTCTSNHEAIRLEFSRVDEKIQSLELTRAAVDGKASRTAVTVTTILSALGLILALTALIVSVGAK